MKSTFSEWFEAQNGPRERLDGTDGELIKRAQYGDAAANEVRRRMEWDRMQTVALYAWNASAASPQDAGQGEK